MNFLAHLYLSCSDPYLMQGNFLADFLKNKDVALLEPELKKGIELHRLIDSYTDNHAEVRRCTKLLRPSQGKFAPVVVDILFDYVLFHNWSRYSGETFEEFEVNAYNLIGIGMKAFPGRMPEIARKMIEGHFLQDYISKDGLRRTFRRVESRLTFKSNMSAAITDLEDHYEELEKSFNLFFPDVIAEVDGFCAC